MTQSELPAALEDKVRYRWDHFSESTVGRWLECRVERLPERGVKRESVVPLHDLLHCLKTSTRTTRQRVQGRRIGNGDDRDVIFLAKLLGGFDDAFGGMGGNLASPIEPKKFSLMILCFDQADVS